MTTLDDKIPFTIKLTPGQMAHLLAVLPGTTVPLGSALAMVGVTCPNPDWDLDRDDCHYILSHFFKCEQCQVWKSVGNEGPKSAEVFTTWTCDGCEELQRQSEVG
jgi:hypothetical protein